MRQSFQAVKATHSVYWVGAIDGAMRDFHGYLTSQGTTYNAYLILADKITLIDTVKAPFVDGLLSRALAVAQIKQTPPPCRTPGPRTTGCSKLRRAPGAASYGSPQAAAQEAMSPDSAVRPPLTDSFAHVERAASPVC